MASNQFGKVISVDEAAQRSKTFKHSGLVSFAVNKSRFELACAHSRRLGGNIWARIGNWAIWAFCREAIEGDLSR